jgi:hypothetical protein
MPVRPPLGDEPSIPALREVRALADLPEEAR